MPFQAAGVGIRVIVVVNVRLRVVKPAGFLDDSELVGIVLSVFFVDHIETYSFFRPGSSRFFIGAGEIFKAVQGIIKAHRGGSRVVSIQDMRSLAASDDLQVPCYRRRS